MVKVGRPKLDITPQDIKKAEALASQGLTQEQIFYSLGIGKSTYYLRKAEIKEFSDAIKRGQAKGIAKVTNALFNKAIGGDNVSMIFYLKNRDPYNWSDKPSPKDDEEEIPPIISFQVSEAVGDVKVTVGK